MIRFPRSAIAIACGALLAGSTQAGAAVPGWLQAMGNGPAAPSGAHATVLLDEVSVTVTADGKARTVRHYAVRVDDRAGRDAAVVRDVYVTGSGNVRAMRGWLLRRSGAPRELGAANTVDAALTGNDIYNDVRIRVLRASDEVADGDVFGAEVESEERLLFDQFEWSLQNRWPVQVARRAITLPAGWHTRAVTFNQSPIAGRTDGQTITWEATNLPEIHDEPSMPPLSSLVPRLVVSLFGDDGSAADGQFDTWGDVSSWLDTISRDVPSAPPAIVNKARELTASSKSELDRIAAIGGYVQHVQYVSIQTGIGRGGGYQPRPPATVLERNYGDCKDKAGLMRALLGAAGIKAYLVTIYSGDRDYVRAEWPSPQQFNHAIVAIAVQPETKAAGVFEHPSLGRLMFFDPTDEFTPAGELPIYEQGSLALVISPQSSALTRVPVAPREGNRLERSLEGSLSANGALSSHVQERSLGARATGQRAMARALDPAAYRSALERRLAGVVPGAVISNLSVDSATGVAPFALSFDVAAPAFAQPLGTLLLVKLPFGVDDSSPAGIGGTRRNAVMLESEVTAETIRLQLPAGMTVDEMPDAVSLDGPFGRYSLTYTADAGSVVARREFELIGQTVEAARDGELLAFLGRVGAADTAPLVLKK